MPFNFPYVFARYLEVSMSTINVLIIDDHKHNLVVLEHLLRMENVHCTKLSTTANLVNELDQLASIDVVFLDLHMPGVSGYEALKIIKSHRNFTETKVVVYSVYHDELDNALDAGFNGFLGKPLRAEEFPEQFDRIIRGEIVRYIP
jgi:two-component system, cell cycle response regulator DivK